MANLRAINSVGSSLATFLQNTYPESLREDYSCQFQAISSGELAQPGDLETSVTIYLYRITIDQHLRGSAHYRETQSARQALPLDLHYLITVWADNSVAENLIVAWVMSQLHQHPIMDRSNLSSDGGWSAQDQIHLIPAELSNEDLMRIWDALEPSYRLSVSYIARTVSIDPEAVVEPLPVVATRYKYGEL